MIGNDYTIRHDAKVFQIAREHIRPRMRGASVRIEARRNGEVAARFEGQYLLIAQREPATKAAVTVAPPSRKKASTPGGQSQWMKGFWDRPAPSLKKAIKISNATS